METVLPSQHEAAYHVGLRRHDDPNFGIKDAVRELRPTGLNTSSAATLVYNVSRLLDGERYTRALSASVTDDYLKWIRRDRSDIEFRNALRALELHIEYYENKRKVNRRVLRELLATYRAMPQEPREASILVEWDNPEIRGYRDVLPLRLFAEEGVKAAVRHEVRGPRGGSYETMCDITVKGLIADLDYESHAAFNEGAEMMLGTMRLLFEDEDRTLLRAVMWRARGDADFDPRQVEKLSFEIPPVPPYQPPAGFAEKTPTFARLRPGQAAFRRALKLAHGHRCCVSSCAVGDVLEAAHIDGYRNEDSNNLRNGLLLRSDIHALFDRHLISIDPATFIIHVGSTAMVEAGYADLHGKALRLPKDDTHHPDLGALERHWKLFCQKHMTA